MKSRCYDDPKGLKVKLHEKELMDTELDTINCQENIDVDLCQSMKDYGFVYKPPSECKKNRPKNPILDDPCHGWVSFLDHYECPDPIRSYKIKVKVKSVTKCNRLKKEDHEKL